MLSEMAPLPPSSHHSDAASAAHGVLRTGFVGLGNQGGPIARRIGESGLPIAIWPRRTEAMEPFADVARCAVTGRSGGGLRPALHLCG